MCSFPISLKASGGCALTAHVVWRTVGTGVAVDPPGTVGIGVGVGLGPGVGVPVGVTPGVTVGRDLGVAVGPGIQEDVLSPDTWRGRAWVSRT